MTIEQDLLPIVEVDDEISLSDALAVVERRASLRIVPQARQRCDAAHDRMQRVLSEGRHVYGLTTGFGPLANRLIAPGDVRTLQQNLVYHLASGVPPMLDWSAARAVVLARLMSILQGWSGASTRSIDALLAVLSSRYAPELPARGTVGASGDLTPLAHLVLCLQGRGAFLARDATRLDGPDALDRMQVAPLTLEDRDGLALVNGTSAMTGIALIGAAEARRACDWAVALTAALGETLSARTEAWHPAFARIRPHPGQRAVAADLMLSVADGARCRTRPIAERLLETGDSGRQEEEAGQDPYTLRCAPQVIGAVFDTLDWHDQIVVRELNAGTDNPIFPPADISQSPALHGGNFMGQHVALASDALATALVVLAGLAERQVARLTDEALNRGLPPFLQRGTPGLNSGLMGAQVTATALLAELRARHGSAAAQSISTNAANQDVVSMGTLAARKVRQDLHDLAQLHAILAIAVCQAMDLREAENDRRFSSRARALRAWMRGQSPAIERDRPLGAEISALAQAIATSSPPRATPGSA